MYRNDGEKTMKKISLLLVFVFVILALSMASLVNQFAHADSTLNLTSSTTTVLSSSTITFGDSVNDIATVNGV